MAKKIRRTWAPRIVDGRRVPKAVGIDPLHYDELMLLARAAGRHGMPASISYIVDEILMDYFRMYSPRYGDEIKSRTT